MFHVLFHGNTLGSCAKGEQWKEQSPQYITSLVSSATECKGPPLQLGKAVLELDYLSNSLGLFGIS